MITPEQEASVSQQQYNLILQQYRGKILPDYDKRVKQVRNVLERLIPSSGLTGLKWEIHVIDSEEVNAFVIPGYVISDCVRLAFGKCLGILYAAELT
jgi:predicted Zn-dependent protease